MRKIAIINVGVNTKHPLKSPIYNNYEFEFVPIPQEPKSDDPIKGLDTYREFKSFTGKQINGLIPPECLSKLMHNDPEFITHTYGDDLKPRSKNLNELYKGDTLYYLARLVECNNGNWDVESPKTGFYLVGSLVLDKLVRKSDLMENRNLIQLVKNNAHVKRWQIKPEEKSTNFWVLVGSNKSNRFPYAVPFDKNIAEKILVDSKGKPIEWDSSEKNLGPISSHTRTCRLIDDLARIEILEKHIRDFHNKCCTLG